MDTQNKSSDIIIIGAGIGGLVCGCYLARAGLKVQIIEKNHQVGGYCCSFSRGSISFDACVDTLEACSQGNTLETILRDFALDKEIDIIPNDPMRTFVTDKGIINLWRDAARTVDGLSDLFPSERDNLNNFFNFLKNASYLQIVAACKDRTFSEILSEYFHSGPLKKLFSFMIFETSALSSQKISALAAVMVFRYFFLDSGYYPHGGMQEFAEAFSKVFQRSGGDVLLKTPVEKILFSKEGVQGVTTPRGDLYSSIIIANCAPQDAFPELFTNYAVMSSPDTLQPALSAMILYVALDGPWNLPPFVRFFHFEDDLEKIYASILKGDSQCQYMSCFVNTFDYKKPPYPVVLVNWAAYHGSQFWRQNKNKVASEMINKFVGWCAIDENMIKLHDMATPLTLQKWTGNYHGSCLGWDAIPEQVFPNMTNAHKISGLYEVGHWEGKGFGVATVAYLGKNLALRLLRKYHRKMPYV